MFTTPSPTAPTEDEVQGIASLKDGFICQEVEQEGRDTEVTEASCEAYKIGRFYLELFNLLT